MAKNNNKKAKNNNLPKKKKSNHYPILTSRLRRLITLISVSLVALIIFLSFFGKAGLGGKFLFEALSLLVGKAVYIFPWVLLIVGLLFFNPQKKRIVAPVILASFLIVAGVSGILEIFGSLGSKTGGILGYASAWLFLNLFGKIVSLVLFSVLFVISLLIFWEFLPKRSTSDKSGLAKVQDIKQTVKSLPVSPAIPEKVSFKLKKIESLKPKKKSVSSGKKDVPTKQKKKEKTQSWVNTEEYNYKTPPLDFLSHISQKPETADIEYASLVIKKTLANFGIPVEMGEIFIGPTVTQYTLKPAEGVKLSKIVGLANDLALALAAHPIRIEAPIPGKSLVGIEVPNKKRVVVSLRELLEAPEFKNNNSPLFFPLGKDSAGDRVYGDLEKMPHLLVAGSTGSGKTIFLQSLIVSLLFRNPPQILRMILVDPKRVEFPIYQHLPHLLTPVIFDAAKTVNALNWLVGEMERRFQVLSEIKSRDIGSFNQAVSRDERLREEYGIMPYILLVIDELADLMVAKGREVETAIVRLSQLARAVGIHLVVATQRPSVDVITGLIKANLTSRVSFQVASQVDSRTVLDTTGAEKLLGRGDMLFLSPEFGKPRRLQAPLVLQPEVKKIINYIIKENQPVEDSVDLSESLSASVQGEVIGHDTGFEAEDPLYEEAKRVVQEYKRASASLLQRRLKIGYARAARLLDMLEENGVVGPADGAKPREVYLQEEDESLNKRSLDSPEEFSQNDWHKV